MAARHRPVQTAQIGSGSNLSNPNGLQTTQTACVPCIRLFADEVVIHRTEGLGSVFETERVPLLELSFEYDGMRYLASDADGVEDESENESRDLDGERRARRFLESFGAVPLDCLDDWATSVHADYAVRCEGNVHDFCAFSAYVVPQLRALGWVVEIDRDYPFRVVDREPAWYANVESVSRDGETSQRPDWFGLELGIDLDGRRVNLLPALIELIERSNGKGFTELAQSAKKCLALPVGDGLYLPVPAERARALLRVLAELWEGASGEKGRVEFPLVRTPALLALDEAFAADGASLTMGGDAAGRARGWAEQLVAPALVEVAPPAGLNAQLRPYQVEGLTWLQNLRARGVGGILADDMGLGKTLQTIAHLLTEKEQGRLDRPALIVAPTSLISNWSRELAKFAPSLKVHVFHGADRQWDKAAGADIVIT
ncbi:MAG: Superfamily helicase, family, partial [Myxococcaceae bacterium]|nr:Superfamily helicase, family [Myxococcaceae bacterium]